MHTLDQLRHFLAFAWSIDTWVGNITAGMICAAFGAFLWPPTRRRIDAWIGAHLRAHHDAIKQSLAEHHKAIKELVGK